ncbi:sulfate transporter and sulfate transporter antisigma-factor antagonist [Trichostrongylus colubriformis]|uniref:Sulfate transporter and sulfate transporter antisigma-factor antagonist n=1 Tax=Trichostrongylus colubriformis TaxID=6319 RepID=A0AAN8J0R5_TRICO
MPILLWLPRYDVKNNLLRDAIGGFMVGVMHVPQGIAYAFLAGVPPVVGLYTSFFPVLTYMLFGTARHNSIGSFAVVALMSGKTVYRLSHKTEHMDEILANVSTPVEPSYGPVEVASALTLAIGLVQLSIAFLGLDFLTVFFSDQIVAGFTTGAAVHVFVTQLKDITGIYGTPRRGGVGNAILRVFDILVEIYRINPTTVLVSAVAMTILYIGKKLINPHVVARSPVPVPFELLVVILGVIVSWFLQLETKFRVQIVGYIPTGLPLPSYPRLAILPLLIRDAIPIAVVIIAVHISMAKLLAKQHNYAVDGKQEIYALGFTSSISSCFPVYPNSCSLARTLVNASAGTKTQLFAIFSSIFIFFVLQYGGTFLRPLPMCILASIIIIALLDMFSKFKQLPRLWSISKIDWTIWVVTFVTTACIDVIEGLIIGILFALLTTLVRQQWPQWHILVNIPDTGEYRDVERYPQVNYIESVCVVRFDAPLLFTNVERFREMVEVVTTNWNTVSCNAQLVPSEESLLIEEESTGSTITEASKERTRDVTVHLPDKFLIVDCSGFVYVDMMGINCLKEVYIDSLEKSVRVLYAAAKAPLQKLLDLSDFYSTVSKTNFFPTIHDAVYFARFRKSVVGLTRMISMDNNSYDTVELSDESTQDSDTARDRKASWLNPVYSTLRK